MYARLLRELLVSMDTSDDNIRHELVMECCKRYANDPDALLYVDELDVEYNSEKAIWWYTRPTFMYQMLNKALMTQNINILYKMRFFIKDIHVNLEKLHAQYIETLSSNQLMVYRGLSLSDNQFAEIERNVGGLIAFNTFLSTSIERKVALSFAMQKLRLSGIQSILFEMKINVTKCHSPFADIREISEVKVEKEVLFSMGTVFRIDGVKQLPNSVWQVQLSLNGDEDTQLRQLTEYMRMELQQSHPLFTLGRLMKTLGQYNNAEHFYRMLMVQTKSFSNNPSELAKLHSDLGTISMDKCLYQEALKHFEQSLKYDPNSAECHGNLGLVYQELNQHEKAIEQLHQAIEFNQATDVPTHKKAIQFNNLGTVYFKQKNFEQAKYNYEQALKLRLECLPSTHPDIAQTLSNIGAVCYAQKDYANALSAFTNAFQVKSVSLPSDHPSLAITYNNIARTLFNQGLYEEALTNATKAVDISIKSLTEDHPQTQEFIKNLQKTRQQLSIQIKDASHY